MRHGYGRFAVVIPLAGLIAACASTPAHRPMVASIARPLAPRAAAPPAAPPAVPVPHPAYKVGDPYQVNGVWYYPQEQPEYDTTGIASWYGQDYQGKPTADGEIFDMNAVTGAHPTLPMPVNVRVTNLENGRSIVVRINDRGPYVNGRILDVSEHAADLLGFRDQGLARVRVTFLGRADLNGTGLASLADETPMAIATAVPAAPVTAVDVDMLPPVTGIPMAPETQVAALPAPVQQEILPPLPENADGQVIEMPVPAATSLYVQAGAFLSLTNANYLASRLSSAGAKVSAGTKDGRPIYRVRIGPFQSVDDADAALSRIEGLGQNDAQIVVDPAG
ncbi:MAG TPA: septal ring lytic transglycosylase RlpA family protein [Micropepsaceae bacterium]|nr:septal ring lytic transglycosylase RlpA family protein [Micropepsaceae bacterium]